MITRRKFVLGAAAGAAGLHLPGTAAAARRILGSNEDIRVAVVGLNGRGGNHIDGFSRLPGVRVVALCDADQKVMASPAAKLAEAGNTVATFTDIRELLEDDGIDAISIATPNHWHSLMGIWGCQAGKDVYVEKPVSHDVWEGRQLVRAAERYGRIVQCGTQSRSNPGLVEAMRYVRDGELGAIRYARGLCYKPRSSIGKATRPTLVPNHIDYDLWCGPAPKTPLMRRRLHYDWHWVWPTGNGDLGNQGIHQMDMCRMALGEDELAPRVVSTGGRLGYDDDGETPNTMVTVFDYERAPLVFEVRGLPAAKGGKKMDKVLGASIGVVVYCENGTLVVDNYAGGRVVDDDGAEVKKFGGGGDHYANFIEAVRSREPGDLNGPIEDGHVSSALCHMGNVSILRGAQTAGESGGPKISDRAAQVREEVLEDFRAHVAANGVDVAKTPIIEGAVLELDPEREEFRGDDEANRLARGTYRAPFVVPEV